MEGSQLSSISVPALRKSKYLFNEEKYEIEQNAKRLPRYIPYCTLDDNIIWLDLLANEQDLTFADKMVASNRLNIFSTAVDLIDFLDLSAPKLDFPSTQTIYSVIVSGLYAINEKLINQLLRYDSVHQICLILNEYCDQDLSYLFMSSQKVNVIYNDDPETAIRSLCNDYSIFEIFIQHNNELHTTKNDLSSSLSNDVRQEHIDPTMIRSNQSNINYNNRFMHRIPNENKEFNRSMTSKMFDGKSTFNNTRSSTQEMMSQNIHKSTQIEENNLNVMANNRTSGVKCVERKDTRLALVENPSYQRMTLIDSLQSFSLSQPNDVLALKELEQIKNNLILLNQIVDELQMDELIYDDYCYKQLEEQALKLMIRCDELTDVNTDVKTIGQNMICNIQEVVKKLDMKMTACVQQLTDRIRSTSV